MFESIVSPPTRKQSLRPSQRRVPLDDRVSLLREPGDALAVRLGTRIARKAGLDPGDRVDVQFCPESRLFRVRKSSRGRAQVRSRESDPYRLYVRFVPTDGRVVNGHRGVIECVHFIPLGRPGVVTFRLS